MTTLIEDRANCKIIELRTTPQTLKVILAWWLWLGLFQFSIDLFVSFVYPSLYSQLGSNSATFRICLGGILAAVFMHFNMNKKAKQRWRNKYNKQ